MTQHHRLSQFSALAASAAALGASGTAALAQDAPAGTDNPWHVSVEGGFLWSDFASVYAGGKIGESDSDDANGGYGAFSIGRDISDTLDWRLSAAFTAFEDAVNNIEFEFGDEGIATDDFDNQTVDFDIGWNVVLNQVTWRLFGGLGFAHVDTSSTTGTLDFDDFFVESDQAQEFFGVGPRVGADFSYGQTYGIAGTFSAAVFGGSRDSSGTVVVDGDPVEDLDDDDTAWVGNLRASVGVFMKPGDSTTFTIGYRIDAWINVRDDSASSEFTRDEDIVTHGPFVKIATEF